jgi:hypothetical protein
MRNMAHSLAESVFNPKHYFALASLTVVSEAFSNAYFDKQVPNKLTVRTMVTKFRGAGSVCLRQVVIERQQKELKLRRNRFQTAFNYNYNNAIRLQGLGVVAGSIALCVKRLKCSRQGCVLSVILCIKIRICHKMQY